MDAWGDNEATAMARLVSYPVSYAVEAIFQNKLPSGILAATDNLNLISEWLGKISKIVQYIEVINHKK